MVSTMAHRWLVLVLWSITVSGVAACSDPPPALDGGPTSPSRPTVASTVTSAVDSTEPGPYNPTDSPIRVDQFGYRPGDPKVAVLVDPVEGFDADLAYEPGPELEVRRLADHEVVLSATPELWGRGDVHEQSGDRGWWLDLSVLTEPGSYYVLDPANSVRSATFDVSDDVYDEVFAAAQRAFWYNRGNIAHQLGSSGPWTDAAAYLGPGQDSEARWIDDPDNPATARDLSGGWFDAGDANKYVTFAAEPVHVLLNAIDRHPGIFGDDLNLPESGNGIPDLLDEVMWEVSWFERMQDDDGGVLVKVGLTGGHQSGGLPSGDDRPRYYEEACSSSTIAASGVFAHTAVVLGTLPGMESMAERLEERALNAWNWYQANERSAECDPRIIWAGDADLSLEDQDDEAVVAAIYLYALTGDERFHRVILDGAMAMRPFTEEGFGNYHLDEADALLLYRQLPGASTELTDAIDDRISTLADGSALYGTDGALDLYRAHLPDYAYHWGSNRVKANVGSANLLVGDDDPSIARALAHLHYFHGVNPLGMTYLTNMTGLGAERSVEQLFHYWFGDDTPYDRQAGSEIGVPPGYVVGGPNRAYSGGLVPPAGQPPQKSYADLATYGSDPSWEITEPAIYYQAAYVRLLADILGLEPTASGGGDSGPSDGGADQ